MTNQTDFKVGDIVIERTEGGNLDARTLGEVIKVFDDSLSVLIKPYLYARTFRDGIYHLPKNKAVLANARLVYHLLQMENSWKMFTFEDLKPMYFKETKK